ncbi:MAG: TolC family protein [Tidjanibacter sp.]|nr:TolC family protein [Tidjanibacter sp.]
MKKVLLFITTAFMSLSAATVSAQESNVIELDLQQAVAIAMSENPTIKIANMEIERQDWVRKETASNLLPSLSAVGSYERTVVKTEMAKGLSFGADNTWTGNASLSVPLFVPTVYQMLKMNRVQMATAVESARASKITLECEVKKAYYNILLAQQSLVVLHKSRDMIQETVNNTQEMFNNGLASEYDLLSAQVQLSSLRPTILQTETSIESAKLLMKMYLGLPEDIDIVLKGNLDSFVDQVMQSGSSFDTDISNNTNLKSLELQSQLLNEQLKLTRAQRMPTIAAFGSATITGNDMKMNFDFGGMGGDSNTDDGGRYWWQNPMSAGVNVSIPLFSGFANTRKAKEIRTSISQLDMQQQYLEQSLNVQVRNAINTILTARESIYSNEVTVQQAEKAYKIATARYNAGGGTILELNSSELAFTEAKLNYSQAIYNYLSAVADYEQILGKNY